MAEPKKASTRARPAPVDRAAREKRAAELAGMNLDKMFGLGNPDMPPRVFVHGEKGIGKTGFFANIPGVTFLAMENGINHSLNRYQGSLETYDDLILALEYLAYGKHPHKFVVLETAAEIERRLIDRVEARLRAAPAGPQSIAEINETERGAGYNIVADEWQIVLDLLDVMWKKGIGYGITAHTRPTTVAGLHGGPDYQRYEPQFSMSTRARGLVAGAVDALLFFAVDVSTSKNAQTGKVTALLGQRWMYFHQEATHDAKCRGRIPWPRRALLDVRRGWRDFSTLYDLITRHGVDLPSWLFEEASKATLGLPGNVNVTAEQRRIIATGYVVQALETVRKNDKGEIELDTMKNPIPKEPDYLTAWNIIEKARAESTAHMQQVAAQEKAAKAAAAKTAPVAAADPKATPTVPAKTTSTAAT